MGSLYGPSKQVGTVLFTLVCHARKLPGATPQLLPLMVAVQPVAARGVARATGQ